MTGRGDGNRERDRAVTVQIGAVILFGFLIVALSTYQATVVPDQNREVEFLHSQEVKTDMVELSSSITATGRTGDAAPATVKLGTRYPSRAFFVNPPPASGSLRTVEPAGDGNVTLENVSVVSSANGEAADYWDVPANRNKSTRFVVYEPGYNLYREAPTTRYESGVAFDRFSNGANLTLTDQQVVEGDRITLIAVSGDLTRNGVSTMSVDPEAVSTVSRRERVDGKLNVTIPTTLNATRWEELLAAEIDDGWVNGTQQNGPNRVTIELNDSRTYSLGIAAVHVGSGDAPDRSPAYLDVDRRPSEMSEGTTREVVVEVRDQFGNPVSGTSVTGYAPDGSFVGGTTARVRTNDDGRAVFEYTAGSANTTLNFSFADDPAAAGFDASTAENASVDVAVNDGGGDGGGDSDGPNPSESGDIRLEDETRVSDTVIDLELNNTAENTVVNVTRARLNFYFESKNNEFDFADIRSPGDPNSARLQISGPFETLSPQIALQNATTTTVRLEFGSDQGNARFNADEFFVITLEFDSGESDTYFINTD